MKRLGMIAFILALVLCFAMPASAVKIFPYNMPLQDIVTWDRFDEEFRVANPENEAITVAWPEDVDYWNYDGDFWKYNLPDGDEFLFLKGVNVGHEGEVITYTQGEPIFEVWGTCAGTDGDTNAMVVYVMSILTGQGQVGRAAEFVLAPTAQMGTWGNALKGYLDMTGASGSTGLLSGICAEILLPDEAMTGTYGVMELELVAPTNFVAGALIADNNVSFLYARLSGDAKTQIDNNGRFMNLQGLTPLDGNLLSLHYLTLKCSVGAYSKYLVLSHKEDGYSAGTDGNPILFDVTGESNLEIYNNYTLATAGSNRGIKVDVIYTPTTATGIGAVYGVSAEIEIATGKTMNDAAYQNFAALRGHANITGILDGAGVWVSAVMGSLGPNVPEGLTTFKTLACFTAYTVLQIDPGTGDFAAFLVANAGGYRFDYGFLALEAVRYGVGIRPNKGDSVLESGLLIDATNVSMVYNVIEVVDVDSMNYFLKSDATTGAGFLQANVTTIDTQTLQHVIVIDVNGDPGYIAVYAVPPS